MHPCRQYIRRYWYIQYIKGSTEGLKKFLMRPWHLFSISLNNFNPHAPERIMAVIFLFNCSWVGHVCVFLLDPGITKLDEPKKTLCWLKEWVTQPIHIPYWDLVTWSYIYSCTGVACVWFCSFLFVRWVNSHGGAMQNWCVIQVHTETIHIMLIHIVYLLAKNMCFITL